MRSFVTTSSQINVSLSRRAVQAGGRRGARALGFEGEMLPGLHRVRRRRAGTGDQSATPAEAEAPERFLDDRGVVGLLVAAGAGVSVAGAPRLLDGGDVVLDGLGDHHVGGRARLPAGLVDLAGAEALAKDGEEEEGEEDGPHEEVSSLVDQVRRSKAYQ